MGRVFDWLFGRKAKAAPQGPLEIFDAAIAALERQTQELRKGAATLLALREGLTRGLAQAPERLEQLDRRREQAQAQGQTQAVLVLDADVARLAAQRETDREALRRCEADAQLLLERAQELSRELTSLKAERQDAKIKLAAGAAVTGPLATHGEGVVRALKLDGARDEVERAHALAELVREDAQRR